MSDTGDLNSDSQSSPLAFDLISQYTEELIKSASQTTIRSACRSPVAAQELARLTTLYHFKAYGCMATTNIDKLNNGYLKAGTIESAQMGTRHGFLIIFAVNTVS